MQDDPKYLREQAQLFRRVAVVGRRSNPHLLGLAKEYEDRADAVELARAGSKPTPPPSRPESL